MLSEYACNDNTGARVSRAVFSGLPECTRAEKSRDVHFACALAAVKSHCFRYWSTRAKSARRAENTIARIAPCTTHIMHIRTLRAYMRCAMRAYPNMKSSYTIHYVLGFVLPGSQRLPTLASSVPYSLCPSSFQPSTSSEPREPTVREHENTNSNAYRRILPHLLHFINGF